MPHGAFNLGHVTVPLQDDLAPAHASHDNPKSLPPTQAQHSERCGVIMPLQVHGNSGGDSHRLHFLGGSSYENSSNAATSLSFRHVTYRSPMRSLLLC